MSEHIVSRKVYYTIFGALLVLTALTVFVAGLDLGPLNVIVALAIAFFKATLVALYFMHVRYSRRLTQVVVAGGLFWFLILISLTMSDYLSRPWFNNQQPPSVSPTMRETNKGSFDQPGGRGEKDVKGNDQKGTER